MVKSSCIAWSGTELKMSGHWERAPWSYTEDAVVAGRVAFNVAQIAKTAQRRRLTDRGIRRLRRELTPECGPRPVIVFTEDAFGLFHIEEVIEALGFPPAASLRRDRNARNARDQPLS